MKIKTMQKALSKVKCHCIKMVIITDFQNFPLDCWMLTQTILEFILFYNIYLTVPSIYTIREWELEHKKNRSCKICFIYIVAKNTQGKNQHIYANASQVSNMMFLMFMFFFSFYAPFQTISIIK